MPVPNPADPDVATSRLAMQAAVFSCYILVAMALLFCAWRIASSSEMIDRVTSQQTTILEQQTAILREIKDARAAIPAEVKSAIPAVVKGLVK